RVRAAQEQCGPGGLRPGRTSDDSRARRLRQPRRALRRDHRERTHRPERPYRWRPEVRPPPRIPLCRRPTMTDPDLIISASQVVTPAGTVAADVSVRDGVIVSVSETLGSADITLRDDEVLLPGLVDTHVHVNEPGRTDWEGFATATAAAAA